jgi:hypothetical protein
MRFPRGAHAGEGLANLDVLDCGVSAFEKWVFIDFVINRRKKYMAHVIVVGGTGMLREVSLFLAKHDNTVSVIGLEREDLNGLALEAQKFNGRINPILVDYRDPQALEQGLCEAMRFFGPLTLAVAWITPDALPGAANTLAAVISAHSPVCRYFQVLPGGEITGKDRRFLDNLPGAGKDPVPQDHSRFQDRARHVRLAVEPGDFGRHHPSHSQ